MLFISIIYGYMMAVSRTGAPSVETDAEDDRGMGKERKKQDMKPIVRSNMKAVPN